MPSPVYDVAVVGLGAMGVSALYQLANRGLAVLGLDAHNVPNALGSSHGGSRAFRLAYFEHSGYVPLLKRARSAWRELEERSGRELFIPCGGLYLGLEQSSIVEGCRRAAAQHALKHELLSESDLRRRWPQFSIFPGACAVYEQHAGICRVEESIRALAELARQSGAELHEHEPVLDWQTTAHGLRLSSPKGEYEARRMIFSLGAYAGSLVRCGKFSITPTRQYVGWFEPRQAELAGPPDFPVWAADFPDGEFWYGFGAVPGSPGLKLGRHQPGPPIDPESESRSIAPAEAQELRDFALRWLPQAAGELAQASVCFYENSPDGHFILDWHPDHPGRVLLACGGSGHAFKFTPVIGELLADLAMTGSTQYDIGFLGLRRFD